MDKSTKERALKNAIGEISLRKGDELVFFCPRTECLGKSSPKLSVNIGSDYFHCWRCGWKGRNFVPLLRLRGSTPELRSYLDEKDFLSLLKDKNEKKYDQPALPRGFKSLSTHSRSPWYRQAMEYLTKRGLTQEQVWLYKLGYCDEGEYKDRIIIPSFDERGHLNFVTSRAIYDNVFPRYKNGNYNKDVIFNDYMIDWSKEIIVTEGFFDSVVGGTNAIPLQGTILTEDLKLFKKIVTTGVDVYFALDTDAMKKQVEIVGLLLEYGVTSKIINLRGKKDLGSMTHETFVRVKEGALSVANSLDLLRVRALS